MTKQAPYEVPADLKEIQQRFAEWRGSHSGRRPIPETLWAVATESASRHGVFRTAQVLRLDYTKLKQRTQGTTPAGRRPSAPPAAFVELMGPSAGPGCECIIEMEGRRGRMRIEWKGPAAPDLTGLSRMLWEPGA